MSAEPVPDLTPKISVRPGLPHDVAAFVRKCLRCSNVSEVRFVGRVPLRPPPGPSPATLAYHARDRVRRRRRYTEYKLRCLLDG